MPEHNQTISIDSYAADNGIDKPPAEWSDGFNRQNRWMVTAPEIYWAGKNAPDDFLVGLRADMSSPGFLAGTKIVYGNSESGEGTNFSALEQSALGSAEVPDCMKRLLRDNVEAGSAQRVKIVHNYGSTVAKPITIELASIPFYDEMPIDEALRTDGLEYVQGYFHTDDEPETIIDSVKRLAAADSIYLWTHDIRSTIAGEENLLSDGVSGGNAKFIRREIVNSKRIIFNISIGGGLTKESGRTRGAWVSR